MKHILLILISIVLFTVAAIIWAQQLSPSYTASMVLVPRTFEGISMRSIPGLSLINPDTVLADYIGQISSHANQVGFISDSGQEGELIKQTTDQNLNQQAADFGGRISVKKSQNHISILTISLNGDREEGLDKMLRNYVLFSIRSLKEKYQQNDQKTLQDYRSSILFQVESLITLKKIKMKERIKHLEDAVTIAKQAGIVEPVVNTGGGEWPLYLLGSRALNAELEILKKNATMLPFDAEIIERQMIAEQLSEGKIDYSGRSIIDIDRQAYVIENSISSRKKIRIMVGVVFGVFFGIIAAMVVNVYSREPKV